MTEKDMTHSTLYYGVCIEARAPLLHAIAKSTSVNTTVALVSEPSRGQELTAEIISYESWENANQPLELHYFAEDPPPDIDSQRRSVRISDRLAVLSALIDPPQGKRLIVATPEALLGKCPIKSSFNEHRIRLEVGQNEPFINLVERLVTSLDYDSEAICEQPGQLATRGGLIDIYPFDAPALTE